MTRVVTVKVSVVSTPTEDLYGDEESPISTVGAIVNRATEKLREALYDKLLPGTGNTLVIGVEEEEHDETGRVK